MPSNVELIAAIREIDRDAKTDGLSNADLSKMLTDLRKPVEEVEPEPDLPPYYVAPGKAVTTRKKGHVLSGDTQDEVKPGDLAGGKDAFNTLLKAKVILKGGS